MGQQRFYGTVRGRTDTMTGRCGTKDSGLVVTAQSRTADIRIRMWVDNDGVDMVSINSQPHRGKATDLLHDPNTLLYYGPMETLAKSRESLLTMMAHDALRKENEGL